jgi:beta-glucosidase
MKHLTKFLFILIMPIFSNGQEMTYPFQDDKLDPNERVADLISRMTLEEKVSQMQDVAPSIERLGIPQYNWWNECLHGVARAGKATSFPQAIGMAATWNPELIHEVADAISTEARAKFNYSVSLGQRNRYQGLTMWTPNINIFRDPRWGRGQETYGEDPVLTSTLGVAFVTGLQGNDPDYFKVIATPKHFAVHSGPEYNRHYFDAYTDKRDLWETYLPAFKATVVEGKAYSVMSAYNRYLGASATASPLLLNEILREQWGFQGYVVSDCGAVYDIYKFHKIVPTPEEAAALAVRSGCDLNCGNTYSYLTKAVEKDLIEEKEIDLAIKRLFLARIKLGLLNAPNKTPFSEISEKFLESETHQKLALKTARESMVLLKNQKETLPISKTVKTITVIGPNANDRQYALGNYFGTPTHYSTILEGIKNKVSKKTKVNYFKGTNLTNSDTIFDVIASDNFKGKVKVEYFNNSSLEGGPVSVDEVSFVDFDWGGASPISMLTPGNFSIRYSGLLQADFTGEVLLGMFGKGGSYKLLVDGKEILAASGGNAIKVESNSIHLEKGKQYKVNLEYRCDNQWEAAIQFLWNKEALKGKDEMMNKVRESDIIVFAGGISARVEGEEMPVVIDGFNKGDRTDLKLPKAQLDLLKELHATGKPVVFVVTSGSAMALNWEKENLPAILNVWYPGQAGGEAVADILFGDYSPSGKLPVTFYKSVNDLPPFEDYHMKGRTYRYFSGEVLYPFGFGLSYTKFSYAKPEISASSIGMDEKVEVKVKVSNVGDFDGETVVQLYVKDVEASVVRPIRSLKHFKKVYLAKGTSTEVHFELSPNDLSVFDDDGRPFVEKGSFDIFVGEDSSTGNKVALEVR